MHSSWVALAFLSCLGTVLGRFHLRAVFHQVLRGQTQEEESRFAHRESKALCPHHLSLCCSQPDHQAVADLVETLVSVKMFCLIMLHQQIYIFFFNCQSQNYLSIPWKNRICRKNLFIVIKKYTTSEIHPTFLKKHKPGHFLSLFFFFESSFANIAVFVLLVFSSKELFCAFFSES